MFTQKIVEYRLKMCRLEDSSAILVAILNMQANQILMISRGTKQSCDIKKLDSQNKNFYHLKWLKWTTVVWSSTQSMVKLTRTMRQL